MNNLFKDKFNCSSIYLPRATSVTIFLKKSTQRKVASPYQTLILFVIIAHLQRGIVELKRWLASYCIIFPVDSVYLLGICVAIQEKRYIWYSGSVLSALNGCNAPVKTRSDGMLQNMYKDSLGKVNKFVAVQICELVFL